MNYDRTDPAGRPAQRRPASDEQLDVTLRDADRQQLAQRTGAAVDELLELQDTPRGLDLDLASTERGRAARSQTIRRRRLR